MGRPTASCPCSESSTTPVRTVTGPVQALITMPSLDTVERDRSVCCAGVGAARYVDQGGGKRKGSFAIYLEPWHADIFDFLDLRKVCLAYLTPASVTDTQQGAQRFPAHPARLLSCGTEPRERAGAGPRPLLRTLDPRPLHAAGRERRRVVALLPQRGARPGGRLRRRLQGALREVSWASLDPPLSSCIGPHQWPPCLSSCCTGTRRKARPASASKPSSSGSPSWTLRYGDLAEESPTKARPP